jgi:glycosyltransferase involved in cell wall biosynthesis
LTSTTRGLKYNEQKISNLLLFNENHATDISNTIIVHVGDGFQVLRILWFNWRDIKNPDSGGAEVLTHEIATRLVKNGGYDITLFSAWFPGSLHSEIIDGIKVVRDGGIYSVYEKAKKFYKKNKDDYDIVIDEINGKPFLTPKFVKLEKPIVALIHSISSEQFLYELPFPANYLCYHYLEKRWLSYYKNTATVTVSDSSKRDLEKLGFRRISIIPEGLSIIPLPNVPSKETIPTVLYIGRLKKHKLPHHAILAFLAIKKKLPDARLWIIGDGYMRKELQEKYDGHDITFYGRVSTEIKSELLSKAHITLVPATREGWGLVVTESNAVGTPVIAYNVPGLRDSVKDGETGVLVRENSPASLASSAIYLLKDRSLLEQFSLNALSYSRQFSWDTTTEVFDKIIKETIAADIRC